MIEIDAQNGRAAFVEERMHHVEHNVFEKLEDSRNISAEYAVSNK